MSRDDAMGRRSEPRATSARCMLVSPNGGSGRPDRQQVDPLGQDRRLSRHARQRAGAGAEPARQPGRRPWRRRCRTTPSPAARRPSGAQSGFRRRHRGMAERQPHQPDLHRRADQHPASASRIVRVDDPAALPLDDDATADPNDEVIGVDFSGGLASVVTQLNTAFGGATGSSPIPPARRCACSTTARANTTDVNALSLTRTATALAGGACATAVVHRRRRALHRRDHRERRAAARALPAASPSTRRCCGDPSKLVLYGPASPTGDPTRPEFHLPAADRRDLRLFAADRPRQRDLAVLPATCRTSCGRC